MFAVLYCAGVKRRPFSQLCRKRKLTFSINFKYFRHILRTKWQHKITNEDVLRRAYHYIQASLSWSEFSENNRRAHFKYSDLYKAIRSLANVTSVDEDCVTKTFRNANWRDLKTLTLMSGKGLRMTATNTAYLLWRDNVNENNNFLRNQIIYLLFTYCYYSNYYCLFMYLLRHFTY